MPGDRPEHESDDVTAPRAEPASGALVPLAPSARGSHWWRWAPDPIFVTHLIAAAQQAPQTRRARRAALADAQAAYQTRQSPARTIGSRTRQLI
jgi:hypothetical protein